MAEETTAALDTNTQLSVQYRRIRKWTERICQPLSAEDHNVQPVYFVSPPKWHLGHTTWYFETFILKSHCPDYQEYDPQYNFLFNSYYETIGERVVRGERGNLTRPSLEEVMEYRRYVDQQLTRWLENTAPQLQGETFEIFQLGLNHEQQHQELLYTDLKYILAHNPLLPAYSQSPFPTAPEPDTSEAWCSMPEGLYTIGYQGEDFCFDNEKEPHPVYLQPYHIRQGLVSNGEYLAFMEAGGYQDHRFWHAEGWDWVNSLPTPAPLYWHRIENEWHHYTLRGLEPLQPDAPVTHISYFEAAAFADWAGYRLPTEQEWEAAQDRFSWGSRWEWCESAYLPYPGYQRASGAVGEYNGKFMVNQMIARGASVATPEGHSRPTYRNFFHPPMQWQFFGIRLAANA